MGEFDKLCVVQSDKASVEITSPYAGIIRHLHYKEGDIVKVGAWGFSWPCCHLLDLVYPDFANI